MKNYLEKYLKNDFFFFNNFENFFIPILVLFYY